MPELPEVETIRRDLEREVVTRRIKTAEVSGTRTVRRQKSKEFIALVEGEKIDAVGRRGKYLTMGLSNEHTIVVHLRMSGQLLRAQARETKPKHTHVVLTFTQGGQLRFVDPRTFGEVFVHPTETLGDLEEFAEMGFDPVEEPKSWTWFAQQMHARKRGLKALLMDQHVIAGLGNIYSDEILFDAGLRYDHPSDELTTQEYRRLYRSLVETLHEAIKHRGSTLDDNGYLDLAGKAGSYQDQHQVYNRDGQACRRCRTVIVREKFAGRSTFFCPQCQV